VLHGPSSAAAETHIWWQRGVIYQIYPRSFLDVDGDGVGDLRGIARGLAYLGWLGVDAIWISPFYPSPMADFGYDISDHTAVDPRFGSLGDFDALLAEAHRHGIRVILDYVPNHTSDQHPWFTASRSARGDQRRAWYVWRDPAPGGGPPNNWRSVFGGSAWTWDGRTAQYYYHAYLREQPDLNWRHPPVQEAMLDVLRFWLDRGVDGFRVDALRQLVEDEQLRDNPPNPDYHDGLGPYQALLPIYTADRPETLQMAARMRQLIDGYPARLLIGELYLPIERLVAYYGSGVHLPSNFHLISVPWQARRIGELVMAYEKALPAGAWPNWVLGNHDKHRVTSRVGLPQARVAAMLLLSLRGTPTMYYGDEIGMRDVDLAPDQVQDPWEKNVPGLGLGRDPERTPMQWDAGPNAGFTTGRPWLPVAPDAEVVNVARQRDDPGSMLHLYRRLLALRRARSALSAGSYAPVEAGGEILAYVRDAAPDRCLVALNLGPSPERLVVPPAFRGSRVLISTAHDREGDQVGAHLHLRGDEGIIAAQPDGERKIGGNRR
jgi:alpha-glucosidase